MECIEINRLCKCKKKVRSSEACILINSCTESSRSSLSNTRVLPPWWNLPWRGEEAFRLRGFDKVRQRGELNWASQL